MSRWDARPLQGAASVEEDDGGEALADELAAAFTSAIEAALSEQTAQLPMTAFDFDIDTHGVKCRVVTMKSSVFVWVGGSGRPAIMPALSVAATGRLGQAVPLVSTLFDHSGGGVGGGGGGGGAGGGAVGKKAGALGAPLPAATSALFGARDSSESLAQVRVLVLLVSWSGGAKR